MKSVGCICITKNRLEFLKKSIVNFLNQDYYNKQLLILYYSSDLETSLYLESNKFENVIIYKYIEIDNIYLGSLRNIAIQNSNTDLIMIWDDDDIYSNDRISKSVNFLNKHNLDACALSSIIIYNDYEFRETFHRNEGWEGSLLFKKDVFTFYENKQVKEDTNLLLYFHKKVKFKTFSSKYMYIYVFHESNTSGYLHKQRLFSNSKKLSIKQSSILIQKLCLHL